MFDLMIFNQFLIYLMISILETQICIPFTENMLWFQNPISSVGLTWLGYIILILHLIWRSDLDNLNIF